MYYFHVFYEHCSVIVEQYYLCYINDRKAPKQAGGPFQAVVILRNNIFSYSVFSHIDMQNSLHKKDHMDEHNHHPTIIVCHPFKMSLTYSISMYLIVLYIGSR